MFCCCTGDRDTRWAPVARGDCVLVPVYGCLIILICSNVYFKGALGGHWFGVGGFCGERDSLKSSFR